jgi:hypothetical protein
MRVILLNCICPECRTRAVQAVEAIRQQNERYRQIH